MLFSVITERSSLIINNDINNDKKYLSIA